MTYQEQLKTKEWKEKRLLILKRDNFQCRYCGKNAKEVLLNVHHLYYESNKKAWQYDNEVYITLCEDHHKLMHSLDKVISLIALNVIKYKIDLIELSSLIELYNFDKVILFNRVQSHYEHKIKCYESYGFETEYFKEILTNLKRNLEAEYGIVLKKVDSNYKYIDYGGEEE